MSYIGQSIFPNVRRGCVELIIITANICLTTAFETSDAFVGKQWAATVTSHSINVSCNFFFVIPPLMHVHVVMRRCGVETFPRPSLDSPSSNSRFHPPAARPQLAGYDSSVSRRSLLERAVSTAFAAPVIAAVAGTRTPSPASAKGQRLKGGGPIITLEDGAQYQEMTIGDGATPHDGDRVAIHYSLFYNGEGQHRNNALAHSSLSLPKYPTSDDTVASCPAQPSPLLAVPIVQ